MVCGSVTGLKLGAKSVFSQEVPLITKALFEGSPLLWEVSNGGKSAIELMVLCRPTEAGLLL